MSTVSPTRDITTTDGTDNAPASLHQSVSSEQPLGNTTVGVGAQGSPTRSSTQSIGSPVPQGTSSGLVTHCDDTLPTASYHMYSPSRSIFPASMESRTVVSLRKERERPNADSSRPAFLSTTELEMAVTNPNEWYGIVLPYISNNFVFEIRSLTDVYYFGSMMLAENTMPMLYLAITAVSLPEMYWFPGISNSMTRNPYLIAAVSLPNLRHLSITFHTAGLTTSRHTEHDRIRLEHMGEFDRSKELKVKRVSDVTKDYELDSVFKAGNLQTLHLVCIDSQMVRSNCSKSVQDPLSVFRDIRNYFRSGFLQNAGREIAITTMVIGSDTMPGCVNPS